MDFKQSPVIFNEEQHSYYLGEKRLLGITGLIHSILGLGVYPGASDYTKDFIIPRAGSRGTAVHHAIQTYDTMGIRQTSQLVRTRYGCKERDNIQYIDETWDVTYELDRYIRHLNGFKPLANELTVSDNDKWASQIDNVWLREATGGIWLVDTKTNNTSLYPLCGYFNPNHFTDGVDALKEYLSWQLSIYAVLFEAENPGMKVEGLACNWLRKDDSAFWVIERKPDELVQELLTTEYIFTDNGPAYFHHNPVVFGITANLPATQQESVPVVPHDVIAYVADLLRMEREVKAKLEDAKKGLRAAMEQHGLKSWDSGRFKATIAKDSERAAFDSTQFRKDHPDLYARYVTMKTTKGGFTIKPTDND
ncbi:MAG: hypothetical protein NC187_08085 [Candidatus Amulumruptor caecigallinarius]|nr:hypothetical protein [Candidatus Amulumruptor caecigallinarius]MCM1397427.1 hypothetical protein [Candidatus Amulumruptor caecigallinarius]MCM1454366.1 hypothetical protein [bacterium]